MAKALKAEQLLAVSLLAVPNRGGKTYEEIAKECGVTSKTLREWRNDPTFDVEYKKACNRIITDKLADINNAAVSEFLANPDNAAMYRELQKVAGNVAEKLEIETNQSVVVTDRSAIEERIKAFKERSESA